MQEIFKSFIQVFIFFNSYVTYCILFFKGMLKHQYKRPSGTRWVEHQETALKASNQPSYIHWFL